MIRLYTAPSPNGVKVSIALEELGLDYEVRRVKTAENEQFEDWFLKLNPNHKIPVIDDDKVAAVLYGDNGSDEKPIGQIGDLERVVTRVARDLDPRVARGAARLILARPDPDPAERAYAEELLQALGAPPAS